MILVKAGIYREQVTVSASGAAGNPLVIRAVDDSVVVDGADDLSGTSRWTAYGGDVYLAAGVTWNPKQVFVDGIRLASSTAVTGALPAGSFKWVSGEGLYVNAGGGNPGARKPYVGRRNYGFLLSAKSYVAIEGFSVTRTEDRGVYLNTSCSNVTLSRNAVTFANRMGIQAVGGSALLLESNVVSDHRDHAISLISGVTGSTVQDNDCFRNAHPSVRQANGIYLFGSPGNLIQRNRLHDNQDSGLHLGGGSNGCVSIQNMSWKNGDHGFDHLSSQNTIVVGNVAYANYKDGFSIEGASPGTHLHNCIAIDNGINVLPADGVREYNLWVDSQSSVGFVSDYNIFWNSTSQPPVKYISTLYSTVAAYSAASGQDTHSSQANPLFADANGGDFHLLPASPAIETGTSGVPNWPATDAEGNARVDDPSIPNTGAGPVPYADRGALEFPGMPDRPPVVAAPSGALGAEGELLTLSVAATDPDGEAIASIVAADLPAGATFTLDPGNASGTLSWTPTFDQAGSHVVTFTALNALAGSAGTVITVANVDRAPIVSTIEGSTLAGSSPLIASVFANDPDGDAIQSLTAGNLPSGAIFTCDPGDTTGTLTWTPEPNQAGSYALTFTATNDLSGSACMLITVAASDTTPVASLVLSPRGTGNAPLTLSADASGSSGAVVSYRFDFGDGTFVGPQASPNAVHTYRAGRWNARVVVTDDGGGTDSTSVEVVVAPVLASPNGIGNPSVEQDLTGWSGTSGAALERVQGGFDGEFALRISGGASGGSFGAEDSPNWMRRTSASGSRYQCSAWVRGLSGSGSIRLLVREIRYGAVVAEPSLSPAVVLSPLWQFISVEVVSSYRGSELDFQIVNSPMGPGESFLVDNMSIREVSVQDPVTSIPSEASPDAVADYGGEGPALVRPILVPSPVRARSILSFRTERDGPLEVAILDIAGRQVRLLANSSGARAGPHHLVVDGRRTSGEPLPSGMYFYRIRTPQKSMTGRFVIAR